MENNTVATETPIQKSSRLGRDLRESATVEHTVKIATQRFSRGNSFQARCNCGWNGKTQQRVYINALEEGVAHQHADHPSVDWLD